VIVAKAPLRLTLGGGGSDLPGFYEKHGGFWVAATIDKYVYVLVKDRFEENMRISYSKLEFASQPEDVQHGVVREALKLYGLTRHLEVTSIGDLPSGSGLGSSGAFTVALLGALDRYTGRRDNMLPDTAYRLERENLNRATGCQDHYAAYFGGGRAYTLTKEGRVSYTEMKLKPLESHLSLFFTDLTRNSEALLTKAASAEETMLRIKQIGLESYRALIDLDYVRFGELLREHWELKRGIADGMSTSYVDRCYAHALKHGASAGKLIGAGGGGFLMLFSETEDSRDRVVHEIGTFLRHVPFSLTQGGLEVKQV
jgi:D-glycero-alpha-D-manno-heptose-7-phosphate kinase